MHRAQSDSADVFTVSRGDDDFRFEGRVRDEAYVVSFEEGFGYRGQYIESCPDDCWKALLESQQLRDSVPSNIDRITRRD
jgi:hypothetical protein